MLEGNVAAEDSVVWARLRAAGMVLVGHTHTHEFAFGGTTDQVGNPWDLARSAGGSSGGSAAALAARMVPAATGTDTAGSVRIPAAMSGISAIKPTHGRVPIGGIVPLAVTLDHAGPMARSLADCSALLQAMADGGAEPSPLMPPPAPLGPLPLGPSPGPRPLAGPDDRGHCPGRRGFDLDPDVADGVEDAARACERLGARVCGSSARRRDLRSGRSSRPSTSGRSTSSSPTAPSLPPVPAPDRGRRRRRGPAAAYVRAQRPRRARRDVGALVMDDKGIDLLLEATIPTPAPPRTIGYTPELPTPTRTSCSRSRGT